MKKLLLFFMGIVALATVSCDNDDYIDGVPVNEISAGVEIPAEARAVVERLAGTSNITFYPPPPSTKTDDSSGKAAGCGEDDRDGTFTSADGAVHTDYITYQQFANDFGSFAVARSEADLPIQEITPTTTYVFANLGGGNVLLSLGSSEFSFQSAGFAQIFSLPDFAFPLVERFEGGFYSGLSTPHAAGIACFTSGGAVGGLPVDAQVTVPIAFDVEAMKYVDQDGAPHEIVGIELDVLGTPRRYLTGDRIPTGTFYANASDGPIYRILLTDNVPSVNEGTPTLSRQEALYTYARAVPGDGGSFTALPGEDLNASKVPGISYYNTDGTHGSTMEVSLERLIKVTHRREGLDQVYNFYWNPEFSRYEGRVSTAKSSVQHDLLLRYDRFTDYVRIVNGLREDAFDVNGGGMNSFISALLEFRNDQRLHIYDHKFQLSVGADNIDRIIVQRNDLNYIYNEAKRYTFTYDAVRGLYKHTAGRRGEITLRKRGNIYQFDLSDVTGVTDKDRVNNNAGGGSDAVFTATTMDYGIDFGFEEERLQGLWHNLRFLQARLYYSDENVIYIDDNLVTVQDTHAQTQVTYARTDDANAWNYSITRNQRTHTINLGNFQSGLVGFTDGFHFDFGNGTGYDKTLHDHSHAKGFANKMIEAALSYGVSNTEILNTDSAGVTNTFDMDLFSVNSEIRTRLIFERGGDETTQIIYTLGAGGYFWGERFSNGYQERITQRGNWIELVAVKDGAVLDTEYYASTLAGPSRNMDIYERIRYVREIYKAHVD